MKFGALFLASLLSAIPAHASDNAENSHYKVVLDDMDSSSRATSLHVHDRKTEVETDSRHFDFDSQFRGLFTSWSPKGSYFAITFDSGTSTKLIIYRLDSAGRLHELKFLPVPEKFLPEKPDSFGGIVFTRWLGGHLFQAEGRHKISKSGDPDIYYTFHITDDDTVTAVKSKIADAL